MLARIRGDLYEAPGTGTAAVHAVDHSIVSVSDRGQNHSFCFDEVFDPETPNVEVFQALEPSVVGAIEEGIPTTVLAYGATGSGKTFTISAAMREAALCALDRKGSFSVSAVEIYNGHIYDLLASVSDLQPLHLSSDPVDRLPVLVGASVVPIASPVEYNDTLHAATLRRRTAPTLCNAQSSRSHQVVTFYFENSAHLSFVDLAGSEDLRRSCADGARRDETRAINESLSALGRCVSALAQKADHVPFRDAKLTRMLQRSMLSSCTLIATVSPAPDNSTESLRTLEFAQNGSCIRVEKQTIQRPVVAAAATPSRAQLLREWQERKGRTPQSVARPMTENRPPTRTAATTRPSLFASPTIRGATAKQYPATVSHKADPPLIPRTPLQPHNVNATPLKSSFGWMRRTPRIEGSPMRIPVSTESAAVAHRDARVGDDDVDDDLCGVYVDSGDKLDLLPRSLGDDLDNAEDEDRVQTVIEAFNSWDLDRVQASFVGIGPKFVARVGYQRRESPFVTLSDIENRVFHAHRRHFSVFARRNQLA